MRIFYCTDHDSIECVSFVIADNKEEAIKLLDQKLTKEGLCSYSENPYNLTEVPLEKRAYILWSGNC